MFNPRRKPLNQIKYLTLGVPVNTLPSGYLCLQRSPLERTMSTLNKNRVIFRHTELKVTPYRCCLTYYAVLVGNRAYTMIVENDFKNDLFLKFGTHYLTDDLRNEFYNLLDHQQIGIELDPAPFMEKVLAKYQLSER